MTTWSEQLSVKNAVIDSEHKNLIVLVSNLEHALKAGDRLVLPQLFEELEHFLCVHFANEEKIAEVIHFPFRKNKLEHEHILETLYLIEDAVTLMPAKEGALDKNAAEYYSGFLSSWVTNHIINEDLLLKPILQHYPYYFNPD